MSDPVAVSLAKIAAERLTPEGQQEKELRQAREKLAGFNAEQCARLETLLDTKEAEDQSKAAADDCIAAGQLMAQGFNAELKQANVDLGALSEFTAGVKEAGGDLKKIGSEFVELCKFRDEVVKAVEDAQKA